MLVPRADRRDIPEIIIIHKILMLVSLRVSGTPTPLLGCPDHGRTADWEASRTVSLVRGTSGANLGSKQAINLTRAIATQLSVAIFRGL